MRVIEDLNIKSISIPPLGAGNGGLQWEKVKKIIEEKLSDLDVSILVYEPNTQVIENLKKERVKLTKARALLLYVLFDLVKNGEDVSEFSSEKVCYFLQRFGAEEYFKLKFEPKFYGPYSGKVRYVLNVLNGSYLMGYSDMDKKPFDPLTLISDGYDDIKKVVLEDETLNKIANKTTKFLNGFYSDFSLELLSSVDFLSKNYNTLDINVIREELSKWNDRKRSVFSNPRYLSISLKHINEYKSEMV